MSGARRLNEIDETHGCSLDNGEEEDEESNDDRVSPRKRGEHCSSDRTQRIVWLRFASGRTWLRVSEGNQERTKRKDELFRYVRGGEQRKGNGGRERAVKSGESVKYS